MVRISFKICLFFEWLAVRISRKSAPDNKFPRLRTSGKVWVTLWLIVISCLIS
jgi:hypothetical protein